MIHDVFASTMLAGKATLACDGTDWLVRAIVGVFFIVNPTLVNGVGATKMLVPSLASFDNLTTSDPARTRAIFPFLSIEN